MCPHGSINKTMRGTEEAPARRLLELGGGGRGCDHQEEEWTAFGEIWVGLRTAWHNWDSG